MRRGGLGADRQGRKTAGTLPMAKLVRYGRSNWDCRLTSKGQGSDTAHRDETIQPRVAATTGITWLMSMRCGSGPHVAAVGAGKGGHNRLSRGIGCGLNEQAARYQEYRKEPQDAHHLGVVNFAALSKPTCNLLLLGLRAEP